MSNQLSSEVILELKKVSSDLAMQNINVEAEINFALEELSELRSKQKEIKAALAAYTNFLMSVETAEEANRE